MFVSEPVIRDIIAQEQGEMALEEEFLKQVCNHELCLPWGGDPIQVDNYFRSRRHGHALVILFIRINAIRFAAETNLLPNVAKILTCSKS